MDMTTSATGSEVTPRGPDGDDWAALVAWRRGDARAAQRLARRYFGVLMRFFLNKTRHADDATDLVAETFLRCSAARARLEQRGSFRTYLFSVAMNQLRTYYREPTTHYRELDDLADRCVAESLAYAPSSIAVRDQDARLLVDALRNLSLAQQIVLELTYLEELRVPQIARLLGLPATTVRAHLDRGCADLDVLLGQLTTRPELAQSTSRALESWARQIRSKIPRC